MGNRIAFVFITLPVHLRDPLARLHAIREETAAFKESERASGGEALLSGLGLLPPPLQAPVARYAASARMYNLVVSNVPGPRVPVYLLGAECVEVLPAIPLSEGHALSIGVFSLRDRVCFGAYADPEALAAGRRAARRPRPSRRSSSARSPRTAGPAPGEAEGCGGRDEDGETGRRPQLSGGVEEARRQALHRPPRRLRRPRRSRRRSPTPRPAPIHDEGGRSGAATASRAAAAAIAARPPAHRGARTALRGDASEPAITARLKGVIRRPFPVSCCRIARNIAGEVVAVRASATSVPRARPGARRLRGGTSGSRART